MRVQDYHIERGEVFERLLIIKDRRTHRRRVPTEANATVLIGTVRYALPQYITTEGGVMLSLTPFQTEWLVDGAYRWDLEVKVSRSALLTSTPLDQTIAVTGTLFVHTYSNLSRLASDGVASPLVAI